MASGRREPTKQERKAKEKKTKDDIGSSGMNPTITVNDSGDEVEEEKDDDDDAKSMSSDNSTKKGGEI